MAGLLLASVTTLTVGCADEDFRFARVSGRVTVGGEPAGGVAVRFSPKAEVVDDMKPPISIGVTDAEGYYKLTSSVGQGRPGAFVGEHSVTFTGAEDYYAGLDDEQLENERARGGIIPTHLLVAPDKNRTTFTVESGGHSDIDFDLEGKPFGR